MKRCPKMTVPVTLVSVTMMTLVAGCGTAVTGNNAANGNGNDVGSNQTNTTVQSQTQSMTYQSETLTLQPGTTATFIVPQGWIKQNSSAGDTGMFTWVNPTNANQWVRVMFSGNVSALQNPSTGKYDVTTYINTQGAQWTNVSSDKLTGQFTLPVGSINNKTTAYGFAQIITKPNPLGVEVEAVAPHSIAKKIATNVHVHATATPQNQ